MYYYHLYKFDFRIIISPNAAGELSIQLNSSSFYYKSIYKEMINNCLFPLDLV